MIVRTEDGMPEQAAVPMLSVVTRLRDAMNEHDLEALVDVFDPDFVREAPADPPRTFRDRDQVRRNCEHIFAGVPDLHAGLLDAVVEGDTVWSEWDWRGTRRDGSPHRMRGGAIQRVRDARAVSVRFYMEPVDEAGPATGEAVRRIVSGEASMAPAVQR